MTTPNELSGLLNYALEGLKRLVDNGQFSVNEDIESLRVAMIRKMNSAKAFIEEQLSYENDPKTFIEESELYSRFILYCKKEKLPTTNKANFTKNMHEYLAQAKQTTQRVAGKSVHVWQFVKLVKSVATVATSLFTPENQPSHSIVNNQPATVATELSHREVTEKVGSQFVEDTQESLRTCGHCDLWHKGGCCFPRDPSCVAPNNPYALDCRSFTAKGENQS